MSAADEAREVEVVAAAVAAVPLKLKGWVGYLGIGPRSSRALAKAVLEALASIRAAERQEAAREAQDAALVALRARLDAHGYDVEPWDKGYRVGVHSAMEDLARQGASLTRARDRADGVAGRRGAALPFHRTEAGWPDCSTCDGGGCLDCTDPA